MLKELSQDHEGKTNSSLEYKIQNFKRKESSRRSLSIPTHSPGFPGASVVEESACNAGDTGLILGSGRSPGEGNGNPLQYSCLANPHGKRKEPGRLQPMGSQELDMT